mmetsp:Transcript_2505/g.6025  ORF Transcript_2505/g.6025 Transcript_2505/m.6025 type:complete len:271 (-) Transcript_2505:2914-3726(-)
MADHECDEHSEVPNLLQAEQRKTELLPFELQSSLDNWVEEDLVVTQHNETTQGGHPRVNVFLRLAVHVSDVVVHPHLSSRQLLLGVPQQPVQQDWHGVRRLSQDLPDEIVMVFEQFLPSIIVAMDVCPDGEQITEDKIHDCRLSIMHCPDQGRNDRSVDVNLTQPLCSFAAGSRADRVLQSFNIALHQGLSDRVSSHVQPPRHVTSCSLPNQLPCLGCLLLPQIRQNLFKRCKQSTSKRIQILRANSIADVTDGQLKHEVIVFLRIRDAD